MKPTIRHARKLVTVVRQGLTEGLGEPEPGKMCVEAAVSYVLGLPHADTPDCVCPSVRHFKISLNDEDWSSDMARGKGMLKLAVAQLGSDRIDGTEFRERLALRVIQRFCPVLFRAQAKQAGAKRAAALLRDAAGRCAKAKSLEGTAAYLLEAHDNARSFKYSVRETLDAAHTVADTSEADSSICLAGFLSSLSPKHPAVINRALTRLADIALDVLKELKSPGCKWLWLCE